MFSVHQPGNDSLRALLLELGWPALPAYVPTAGRCRAGCDAARHLHGRVGEDHKSDICRPAVNTLHSERIMSKAIELPCDGCGQTASTEHFARRLRRLEWTTRYRPVHIHTLLLSALSPLRDEDFLYASGGEYGAEFRCDEAEILDGVGISTAGKARDAVHAEFQRAGFFLTHVLECPLEAEGSLQADAPAALRQRRAAVATRIRRPLKPKSVLA